MAGVTYDTGALVAGDRNDRRMWALHVAFIAEEVVPSVSAPAVAEAWRGGHPQASLAMMLAGCEIEAMTSDLARRVGELAGRADYGYVVDVAVVEGAARRDDDVILTSNETNIRQVIEATGKLIRVEAV
ncbi:MAG: twitching motility protein PilT [Acidimicrobiales bacterium]